MNEGETPRERYNPSNSFLRSLCKLSEMKKTTRSNAVDALWWEHDREAVTSQRTPGGLCASTIELSLRLYCNYALLVLEDANGALVAMLKTLWRCHGDPISFLLCVYQNAERAMCMLKVRAVPWRSRRSTATKRTPLRCRTLLREPWRFPFFRTQQECLGDAAPVWQRFYLVGFLNSKLTGY